MIVTTNIGHGFTRGIYSSAIPNQPTPDEPKPVQGQDNGRPMPSAIRPTMAQDPAVVPKPVEAGGATPVPAMQPGSASPVPVAEQKPKTSMGHGHHHKRPMAAAGPFASQHHMPVQNAGLAILLRNRPVPAAANDQIEKSAS